MSEPVRAYERLCTSMPTGHVRRNEQLCRHTTYRIGGPAAIFAICESLSDLTHALEILAEEQVAWSVLGKGSNVLAADAGYDGAVLVLGREFKRHRADGSELHSGAGVILAALVQDAYSRGLEGFEFAVGIPGTVGGALAMNAGSTEDWIGSLVESVTLYTIGSGLQVLRGPEIPWGYRCSGLSDRGVIVECTLRLEPGDKDRIRRAMDQRFAWRKSAQPLGKPNAGSVFVNPPGESAGRLIEAAGMKGYRVGGAEVSDVHANFIINAGGATAADVLKLISEIRAEVKLQHDIELETEIRVLGGEG